MSSPRSLCLLPILHSRYVLLHYTWRKPVLTPPPPPQVISLALSLPLVSDTVTAASSLASPYMQAVGPYVGPVVGSCSPLVMDFGARAGEVLSDNVKAKVLVTAQPSLTCSYSNDGPFVDGC